MDNDRALALRAILGLLIGAGAGYVLGLLTGNQPLWIGLGAGVGLAFAASLTGRSRP